jgi:glc operon protein GlcG
MKFPICFLLAVIASSLSWAADGPHPDGVVLINHDKVNAAFASGGPLLVTNNFKIQAGHRAGAGEVEIHEHDTDVFYILDGTATFVTGGKAVETRTTSPGEIRGKEITGGEEHHLVKGDVIVIPNGVPHWFKKVDGTFDYFVVKVVEGKK